MRTGACLLGALAVHVSVSAQPALAQHADAGAPAAARKPPAEPKAAAQTPPAEASGVLPKTINPALLSAGTRARLEERVAGRHTSALPLQTPELSGAAAASSVAASRRPTNEPLRRGQARTRVQAVETDEGITILSNRLQPQQPAPRLASLVAQQPAAPLEAAEDEDIAPAAAVLASDVTQTHSLRPLSSRGAKGKGTGLAWLLWPFALFISSTAVVTALWFRKKTE